MISRGRGFWGLFGVTSARDERGTGHGWPSERKNSLQNPVSEYYCLKIPYVRYQRHLFEFLAEWPGCINAHDGITAVIRR